MSENFKAQIERSSFGTRAAQAARRSVTTQKSQSLVQRSMSSSRFTGKSSSKREGK